MRWDNSGRSSDRNVWTLAIGATVGLTAGLLLSQGRRRWQRGRTGAAEQRLGELEERIVDAMLEDEVLSGRAIEVAALTDGIVELTGSVDTEGEADRAAAVAQRVRGVRTVLNRLDVEMLDEKLRDTRGRYEAGDPALHETRWTGVGVGMGRRRQGKETDPDRRDDSDPMTERELGVDKAQEQASEDLDKLAPAVEGRSSGPAAPTDRGTATDASHRRTGNVPEQDQQDRNPNAWLQENIKTGTELTLEESDVSGELVERDAEDRS